MNSRKILNCLVFLFALVLISCEKPAGQGGTSSIKGKIFVKDFNSAATDVVAEYFAVGEKVYISFGDSKTVGNDVNSGSDGSFEFLYLNKGKYTIFAESRDTSIHVSGASKTIAKEIEVNITENGSVKDVGEIVIYK